MIKLFPYYLCECGHCQETIPYSDELSQDFLEYVDQRDRYCLISKSCKLASQISPDRIAAEGENYLIIETT